MPQLDIDVDIAWQFTQDPEPYLIHRPFSPSDYGFDCSALQICGVHVMCDHAGKPRLIPSSISNTVGLYYWARDRGLLRSVQWGAAHRGAIMLKGRWWGYGALGHTSISLGDGTQFAARGSSLGIARSGLYTDNYHDSIDLRPLGVNYPWETPPVDPALLAWLAEVAKWIKRLGEPPRSDGMRGTLKLHMTNGNVTTLVNLLIIRGWLDPQHKTNTYTRWVARAVRQFKLHTPELANKNGEEFSDEAGRILLNPTR
jgi:hypothetical protein